MRAMNTQRSITYRGMAILLGCAIAFLGGTTVVGMGALAETDGATDDRQRVAVTIDEIRAFQRKMFANAPGVDEPARLNLTAEEMYFLEPNLVLPGDTGAPLSQQELQQWEWEREQPAASNPSPLRTDDVRQWNGTQTDR